jgi:ABC-type Fe3+-hydroxamate transport system substrate-binding protein
MFRLLIALKFILCFQINVAAFAASDPLSPQRIITLSPNLAEWTAEILGPNAMMASVVGVSDYSNYPSWVSKIPSIGPYPKINIEKIIALKPTLILALQGSNSDDQLKQLERLKLKVVRLSQEDLSTLTVWIEKLGSALNQPERAKTVAGRWSQELEKIKLLPKKNKTIFIQIQDDPLVTTGSESFLSQALQWVGYKNIFSDLNVGYPKVSRESVIERNPDEIIILDMLKTNDPSELNADRINRWKVFSTLSAVKKNKIRIVSGDDFARCSFRLLQAIQSL